MKLLGIILGLIFLFGIPSAFAISDSYDMETLEISYSHRIDKEFHNGRIAFTFQANASLTVDIEWHYANGSLGDIIWEVTGTSGDINTSVDPTKNYYYTFSKTIGYAVHIAFTLEGNPSTSISGFEIPLCFLALIGTIGLLSHKKQFYSQKY